MMHRRLAVMGLLACVASLVIPTDAVAKWYNPRSWFKSKQGNVEQPAKAEPPAAKTETPAIDQATAEFDGATLTTERGKIVIRLYEKEAPITVANFKKLVDDGFYNTSGMVFHRVVDGFVVQTGDPTGTGYGGSGKTIPLEVKNRLSHDSIGVVAMARGPLPNSATSQFYITLAKQKSLDGKYAIFGEVIQGLGVLPTIHKGDRVYGVELSQTKGMAKENRKTYGKEKSSKLLGMF